MSYRSFTTQVEVYLDDLDDRDLIGELEERGYRITKNPDGLLEEVIAWYKRGNVKEALYQLEKIEPELYGISERVK